jgi:hypothetical protein
MLSSVETNIEVCHVVNLDSSSTISKNTKGKAGAKGRIYEDEELLWLYHKGEDGEEDENEEPQFVE